MRLTLCFAVMLSAALLAPPAAVSAALTVFAAGDIADCAGGDAAASAAAATARMIPDGAPVLVLGDSAYPVANQATLAACYEPTWGRFRSRTYAVPGNHDYVAGSVRDFLAYFGERNPHRTYFRAPLGDWWLIGLDSDLRDRALARQQAWLVHELATIDGDGHCIVAMWHHALHSTGLHQGDGAPMKPAWVALDAAGADVVLSGHEHFYESFEPLDADGAPRPAGIREFVVGTGGAHLRDLSLSSRHRAFAREHGVLELELEPDRYHWTFRTVGGEVRDHGVAPCRRAPQPVKRTAAAMRATTSWMLPASTGP
jgi:3',5'-cyclic AMP phosphodiesterase CpdA